MDREVAIEKLWRNSNPGTKWSEVANAYDAGVAAERERCARLCERDHPHTFARHVADIIRQGPNVKITGFDGTPAKSGSATC